MFADFKKFVMRGNAIDMAVGIIIGAAFAAIANSLVADLIMPPIGLLLGNVDFSNLFAVLKQGVPAGPYASLADAQAAGAVSINYGKFLMSVVSFIIVAFVIFLMVRGMNKARRPRKAPAPANKNCPYCLSAVPVKATRCPYCTSKLD
jgi:large conductance mechanosensitive channel